MLQEVEDFWVESAGADTAVAETGHTVRPDSREVFVVHGRDDGLKSTVARFLEKLDLTPIILHERPDEGRTVIEKLLEESERVAYAVVLLTPDDEGRLVGSEEQLVPRARQNVVFELGYLLGKLGRSGVKALYSEGVELPSDYEGVLYTPMDARGEWKLQLCREMKAAGLEVDANRAL
jgi:predicted nucleotide-binding protein